METTQGVYKDEEIIGAVLELARASRYEQKHAHQVSKLAVRLFDELRPLHLLGEKERFMLEASALLHDIGWLHSREGHHKHSRDMILSAKELPFTQEDRVIVALLARYHRKAMPQDDHKYYGELDLKGKNKVCALASLLRIADGLDRSHMNLVEDLKCRMTQDKVIIQLKNEKPLRSEITVAKKKADLFEKVFKMELVIE